MSKSAADEAYAKGQKDYSRSGGQALGPLSELFHPTYDPPDGYEDEYKAGWNNAKHQDD